MLFGYFSSYIVCSHINAYEALVAEQRFRCGLELPIQQGKHALTGSPPNPACISSGYRSSSTVPFSKPGHPLIFQLFTFFLKLNCPHRLVQGGSPNTRSGILFPEGHKETSAVSVVNITEVCIVSRVCLSSMPMSSKK